MGQRGRPPHPDILTERQWEVLEHIRDGLTDQQIAEKMGISLDGAKYHVSEILSRLGVATRQDAAAWRPERRGWWERALHVGLAAKIAALSAAAISLAFVLVLAYSALAGNSAIEDPAGRDAVAVAAHSASPTRPPTTLATTRRPAPSTVPTATAVPVIVTYAPTPTPTPVATLSPDVPFMLTDDEILHDLTTIRIAGIHTPQIKTNDHLAEGWLDVPSVYSCANDAEDGRLQVDDLLLQRYATATGAAAQLWDESALYFEYANVGSSYPAWHFRVYKCYFWQPTLDYNQPPYGFSAAPLTLGLFNADLDSPNLQTFAENEGFLEGRQIVHLNSYATQDGAAVAIYYPFEEGTDPSRPAQTGDCELGMKRAIYSVDATTREIVRTEEEVRRFANPCVYIPGEYID